MIQQTRTVKGRVQTLESGSNKRQPLPSASVIVLQKNDSTFIKAKQRTGNDTPESNKIVYRTIGGIPHLDMNYTIYGEVVKGLKVLDKIASVKTDKNDRPLLPVRIKTIKLRPVN